MTPTLSPQQREEVLEAMGASIMEEDSCGMSLPGDHRVFCDDERLPEHARSSKCWCKSQAAAALDAALPAIIGAVLETVREDIRKRLAKAHSSLGGVEAPAMKGDNLAVSLCSFFDEGDDWPEGDGPDDCGWSPSAIDGYTQTLDAIRQHYTRALAEEARS